jgi:thioredoxin reductase (NADPH)
MPSPLLLVVDADQAERRLLERDLARAYGEKYRVRGVGSAGDAMGSLRRCARAAEPVALVLADQHLPEMTGSGLLQRARTMLPDTKRVVLTPFAEVEEVVRAMRAGGIDHYVVKPWTPPEQNLYPALDDLLADWENRARSAAVPLRVVGHRFSPRSHETRDFLVRNCIPFQWLDLERDDEARRRLAEAGVDASRLPLVRFPDGTQLVQPSHAEIAEKIGLRVRPMGSFYDLVIVGGGPAGLAAAVYAASEGLRTVMIERHAPGGQAGLSSMIENYLGFPAGLSGGDLARRAVAQARKFEAEIVTPQSVTGIRVDGPGRIVSLSDGSEVRGHALLFAMGVQWRRLDAPGADRLIGAGVYYGGTVAEAMFCRDEEVFLVGGANSAGQAALSFSRYARKVIMLVRGDSLARSMSQYLIDQIEDTRNIEVRLRASVVGVEGTDRLEAITVRDGETGRDETFRTHAVFIFIGAVPHTQCVEGVLARDEHGFILTGPDLRRGDGARPRGWPLDRDPFWLESSVPGIFAAGDVRHGSVKRVAAGVGEGATAVQFIHQYLQSNVSEGPGRPAPRRVDKFVDSSGVIGRDVGRSDTPSGPTDTSKSRYSGELQSVMTRGAPTVSPRAIPSRKGTTDGNRNRNRNPYR